MKHDPGPRAYCPVPRHVLESDATCAACLRWLCPDCIQRKCEHDQAVICAFCAVSFGDYHLCHEHVKNAEPGEVPEPAVPQCEVCGSDDLATWDADGGRDAATGYHDASRRYACNACGAEGEVADLPVMEQERAA